MTAVDAMAADVGRTPRPRDVFIVANNIEELGGVQRVTHNLGELLTRRGHRVTVVGIQHARHVHDYGRRPYRWVVANDERAPAAGGARAHQPDPRNRRAANREKARHRRTVERLSSLFAESDQAIVVVMQVWAMGWVAEADTHGHRVVGMSHESFDATLNSSRWARVQRYYRDVDVLLLLTERDARRFEQHGFNNVGVMHNSLSFYPDRVSELTAPVVVAAGRYAPEKGYDRLIDAFAQVAPRHPDWQLRIFGHGSLRPALRRQAQRLALGDRVQVPGLAGDIEAELRAASVFALSSIHEGLPMALAEAMACGVPCVAFDCAPGVREIVTDGIDGLVVPPRSVRALADGLDRLMSDAELRRRLGAAARESVRRFAPGAVLTQWEDLFDLVER